MCAAFPRSQYYDRSVPPPSLQPQAGPSPKSPRTTTVVPRFRVLPSPPDLRLPLYTRTVRSAPAMDTLGLYPYSQRQSVTKSTFPWNQTLSGTVHLSPSLSVSRLARFRMRPTRIPHVAIVRLRLAVSDQDRVCPYPHVPRASGCLCLLVHNLPGQPHSRGGMSGWLPLSSHLHSGRFHHCKTQLPGALLSTENRATCLPKRGPFGSSQPNLDNRKQGHLFIENRATSSPSGLWAVWAGTPFCGCPHCPQPVTHCHPVLPAACALESGMTRR